MVFSTTGDNKDAQGVVGSGIIEFDVFKSGEHPCGVNTGLGDISDIFIKSSLVGVPGGEIS